MIFFEAGGSNLARAIRFPGGETFGRNGSTEAAVGVNELEDRLAAGLLALCERAARDGVSVGVEPEPGMHIETVADYQRIARRVGHAALGLTLDVGHAHLSEPSAAGAVRAAAGQLVNVHLEGMRRPVHDHLVPWEGDLDVREVMRELDAVGYGGPATLELSRDSHRAVEVARRAIEFLSA